MFAAALRMILSAVFFCSVAQAAPELQIRFVWQLANPTSDGSNILIEYAHAGQEGTRNYFAVGFENSGLIERRGKIYKARRTVATFRNVEGATVAAAVSAKSAEHDDKSLDFNRQHLFSGEEVSIYADVERPEKATVVLKRARENGGEVETLEGTFGVVKVSSRLIQVKRRLDPGMKHGRVLRLKDPGLALSLRRDGSRAGNVLVVIKGAKLNDKGDDSLYEARLIVGQMTKEGIVPSDSYPAYQKGTVVYLIRDNAPMLLNALLTIDTFVDRPTIWAASENQVQAVERISHPAEDPNRPSIHAYARAFESAFYRSNRISRDDLVPHIRPLPLPNVGREADCENGLQGELNFENKPVQRAVSNSESRLVEAN